MHPEKAPITTEIDCNQLKALIDSEDSCFLIDCRRNEEFEFNRIEGATHIPMHATADRANELEPYREQAIVVYCHHGIRSLRVVGWLRDQGFSTAQSLHGGIDAWSQIIDPAVPQY